MPHPLVVALGAGGLGAKDCRRTVDCAERCLLVYLVLSACHLGAAVAASRVLKELVVDGAGVRERLLGTVGVLLGAWGLRFVLAVVVVGGEAGAGEELRGVVLELVAGSGWDFARVVRLLVSASVRGVRNRLQLLCQMVGGCVRASEGMRAFEVYPVVGCCRWPKSMVRLLDGLELHRFHAALLAGVPVHLLALSAALVHDSYVAHLFLTAIIVLLVSRAMGIGAPAMVEATDLGAGHLVAA